MIALRRPLNEIASNENVVLLDVYKGGGNVRMSAEPLT